jgi:uncharacterized BrkB/YihY/UPF0761 family membrane protein
VFYFATLSQVNVVYGSLTTAIVVLLSLEIAATLVLFGAQVIAQFERLERTGSLQPDEPAAGELGGVDPASAAASAARGGSRRRGGSPRR